MNKAPSIIEIIEALETGRALSKMQQWAAECYLALVIRSHGLPPGIPLNRRGRVPIGAWTGNIPEPQIDVVCADNYSTQAALKSGSASIEQQRAAAYGMRCVIKECKLYERLAYGNRGRPRNLLKIVNENEGTTEFVDMLAEAYWRNGSSAPIEDALRETAKIHNDPPVSIETVRKSYRTGRSSLRPLYVKFARAVDFLLAKHDAARPFYEDSFRDEAFTIASQGTRFSWYSHYMLRLAYDRGKRAFGKECNQKN